MSWYDALDNETIEDIKKYQDDLDQLLTIINDLAKDKYNLGFNDGYETGEHAGWGDCYDQYEEEINGTDQD